MQKSSLTEIKINEGWEVSSGDDSISFSTNVPNEIHIDLFNNGFIEHPYFNDNEKKVQWVAENDWTYKKVFDVESSFLSGENAELVFEGIDTYADVFLNNKKILYTDNQFREWRVNVKDALKEKDNELRLVIYSPFKIEKQKVKEYGFQPPDDSRIFTRKAQYVYGWDWAPRLVTSGICKGVKLVSWNGPELKDVFIVQDSLSKEKTLLTAKFEINSFDDDEVILSVNDVEQKVKLVPGNQVVEIKFSIDNPELWWTNGLGSHHLYKFNCSMFHEKHGLQSVDKKIGLRTIELVQEPDSIGTTFYFKLNGIPVFMKGANYIPLQMMGAGIDSNKYQQLVNAAADANMNMLRVWGGGIYEDDLFYDLCDEKGILVWQDFMFANGMYPADSLMINNIRIEAEEQIKRLRNHPSLALWCGNNEIAEGWANWGWKNNFTPEQQKKMSDDYNKIFHQTLPGLVETFSPDIPYRASSPQYGRGNPKSQYEGDSHYWGVWHDAEPFENYENKVPRFMSEFGFQSYPSLSTLEKYFKEEDLLFESPVLQTHQKHKRGNELIKTYMERDYHIPTDFSKFIYVSQLLQAEGIAKGIEAHRRAMPYCLGSLYWQLNDCWPVISWSGIDNEGRWKALHYFAKRYFSPVMISVSEEQDELKIFIVNDTKENFYAKLLITVNDFNGNKIYSEEKNVEVKENSSYCYKELNLRTINYFERNTSFVNIKLISDKESIADKNFFFVRPKEMKLSKPEIILSSEPFKDGLKITLTTNVLAKNVFIEADVDGRFSDNFFDLISGERKEIIFYSTYAEKEPRFNFISLWDIKSRLK
ncbi:MAG: glycoside hydrolase family 2 protein [Ignavibacteriales bacterium]|nr:MAG: glycoside hydrolase family 2 protein [Ignavibacteriales bacterium]